jgi:hypothetical protein
MRVSQQHHLMKQPSERSYNDSVRENGGGLCKDATILRDSLAGLIEPMVRSAGV